MNMGIGKFFNFLQPIEEEDEVQSISLEGPFIAESEVLKHHSKYSDLLEKTWLHYNFTVCRDILIMSNDPYFEARDNIRIEAGITHHRHNIELYVKDISDFEALAVDHFILLNPKDNNTIIEYLHKNPIEQKELKSKLTLIH